MMSGNIFLILLAVTAINSMSIPDFEPDLAPPQIDTSYGAKLASEILKGSVNRSIDPCEDFFSFVCEGYNAKRPLGRRSRVGVNEELQDEVMVNLTLGLKREPSMTTDSKATSVTMTYDIFDACVAADKGDYKGAQVIMDIAQEYGGWPVMDEDPDAWTPDRLPHEFSWIIGNVYGAHGVATLLPPYISVDVKDITKNVLYIEQASLAKSAAYYMHPNLTQQTQNQLRQDISETIEALAAQTGRKLNKEAVEMQVQAMAQIDYELALMMTPATENRNQSLQYNVYNLLKAGLEFDSIDWENFFDGLTASTVGGDAPPAEKFSDKFILSQSRGYMPKLNNYLKKYSQPAELKNLINYIIYRLINPYMIFAGPDLEELRSRFGNPQPIKMRSKRGSILGGESLKYGVNMKPQDGITGQELECASFLLDVIPYVTGRIYVDNSFPPEARSDVGALVNSILASFKTMLYGLTWMDQESKLAAYKKVDNIVQNIAYPDFQQNDTRLDDYYKNLIRLTAGVKPDEDRAFFKYVKLIVANEITSMLRLIDEPADRYEFGMSPAVVNDWYQPDRNSITFPAAQLAPPFYSYDFPKAPSYGAMAASAIGHELVHGFDDEGVQFDNDGTLHTWMSAPSQDGFAKMADCVVEEYNGFCYPQGCVNGINTQGENIADNGGIKAGHKAYMTWSASNGPEARLPDFPDYTMEQIFFMYYGYSWCGQVSDAFLERILMTNEHSPYPERVNGVVRNYPEFGKAFKCRPGSKMYPGNHCTVW